MTEPQPQQDINSIPLEDGKPTEEEIDLYYQEEFWLQTDWDRKPKTEGIWHNPPDHTTEPELKD